VACLSFALSSCAFKESALEKQQEVSRLMDGRILRTSISWDGLENPIALATDSFVKVSRVWTRDSVITLPVNAPETLNLYLQMARQPQDVKEWTAGAFVTTGDDLNERALGAQILESTPADIGTLVKIRLTGADTLFVKDREQRVYLTVSLKSNSGEDVEKFRFVLSTPPSRLTVLKDELITGHFPSDLSPSLAVLSSQAESRMLVRRVLLRNDSFESVKVTVPFRNSGRFSIRGTKYTAEQKAAPHATVYTQMKEDLSWDLDSEVYIYPLSDEIVKTWTSFSQSDLNALILAPGATLDLGFYASNAVSTQLTAHPASKFEVKALPSMSVARCAPGAYISTPDPGWCDLFDGGHGPWHFPPDTIALMKQEIQAMRACIDSGRNVDLCNQAALIDEDLDRRKMPHPANGIPWMVYYGCANNSTCPGDPSHVCEAHHGWTWSTVNGNFQVGIQTAPVTIEWKDKQVSFLTRFAPANLSSDGEARSIVLSPSGTLIRE
jgi:hypothetical protein